MDDPTEILRQNNWTPKANVDESYPSFEGEYEVELTGLKAYDGKQSKQKESYGATWTVRKTLSGDFADGRTLTDFYRFGGTKREFASDYDSTTNPNAYVDVPVTREDAGKAVEKLANDLHTAGFTLDKMKPIEEQFISALGTKGFARAYRAKNSGKQRFLIKRKEDLRKGGSSSAAKKDELPF